MAAKLKPKITAKRKKELKRVKQFIARAEKRGYVFSERFKSSLSYKTTRALQNLTPRKLYDLAEYEVLPGEFIPGRLGRYREREAAALKGKETRKRKKEEQRSRQEQPWPEQLPSVSDIIYRNVMATIAEYPSSEGAQYLTNLLNSEIRNYGLDAVIAGMAAVGEQIVKLAQEIVYYELNSQQLHEALQAFSQIIRGGIVLSKQESIALNEVLENISDES